MLVGMEIALGVLLGLLGVVLAALAAWLVVRRERPGRPAAPLTSGAAADDDLPGFLEAPPGTATAPSPPQAGWAALAPAPAAPSTDTREKGRGSLLAPGATAAAGVLLIALAVALVAGRDGARQHRHGGSDAAHDDPATSTAPSSGAATAGALAEESVPPGSDGVAADLTFRGMVLERHAVGVTATYPTLQVTSDGERSVAHLVLPTFHCLTGEAPEDPVTAGCRRAGTEYADLDSPALSLTGSGERLGLSGAFATYLRTSGGTPRWTGRVYEVEVSVLSAAGTVEGTLDLSGERAGTAPGRGVNELRRGS
jgi:hypothetical protein